jgi:hypothetical protein
MPQWFIKKYGDTFGELAILGSKSSLNNRVCSCVSLRGGMVFLRFDFMVMGGRSLYLIIISRLEIH